MCIYIYVCVIYDVWCHDVTEVFFRLYIYIIIYMIIYDVYFWKLFGFRVGCWTPKVLSVSALKFQQS